MKTAVTAVVVSLLLAPTAWGQTTSTSGQAGSTTTTVVLRPPDAFLSSSSGEVRGEIRSYCWSEGGQGLCADRFGPIDPAVALSVEQGERLTLRFDRAISPTSITVTARDSPGWPEPPPTQTFSVPAANPTQFPTDFPPGTYFLSVFTDWDQGDATYVFEVTVSSPPTSGDCDRLRQRRAALNARIDAAAPRIQHSSLAGPAKARALAQLEAARARGNAAIARALAAAGCANA